ncbi:MAG: hypothetical protein BZ136_06640 [Methanosphaera sp. rholeuAM74]|nr:MAG: hypothetical protein BZ136_06640 [Methanosphaera sp. rholeuAM74]
MTKKQKDYIANFSQNRDIISQFMIKSKQIKRTKNNKPYLELTLQDKTGQIKGRLFGNKALKQHDRIRINDVYNIVGKIQEFPSHSSKYNILIDDIRTSKVYDEDDFIRQIQNYGEHVRYLHNSIKEIQNMKLRKVLIGIFTYKDFEDRFVNAPAAKIHHHNYRGGLLVHTNEVVKICKTLCDIYPTLDRDLLISAAILHDIGKIETYDYDDGEIEVNSRGALIDHIFIGANLVQSFMRKEGVDEDTMIKLTHIILSHHGDVEKGWGSSISPKIAEAVALHHADDMSAKLTDALL